MSTALIGYSGYVGSTLLNQTQFTDLYNSKNIKDIEGKHYSIIVCAGAPAVKWKANKEPEADWANINLLMKALENVTADEFILISTVDVYQRPYQVYEDTSIDVDNTDPYGKHRYILEQYANKKFPIIRIIRLPGLFGTGLKKNFIFDLLNDNCLHLTHRYSQFQFYNLNRIWDDIQLVRNQGLHLVNFATHPVTAQEIAECCFDVKFTNVTEKPPVKYDMRSRFASLINPLRIDYLYYKSEILEQIRSFVCEERRRI